MHVELDESGRIVHAGPTIAKLIGGAVAQGQNYFDVFTILRPQSVGSVQDMLEQPGRILHFCFADQHQTRIKAVAVPGPQGAIVNMSFGISVVEAVGRYNLTNADFAGTDLTVEMLYLVEAKSAAMDESRALNSRLQGAKIAAEEQAFTDTLTGLKNRRALDHVMNRMIAMGECFACMHVDLDYFKSINDTLGHAAGDHVLQIVAQILVDETRAQDTVARVGGDEFVILVRDLDDPHALQQIAERIIARLEEPIPFNGETCRISGSAGTSRSSQYTAPERDLMLHHADIALYASKKAGRAQHTHFSSDMADLDPTLSTGERGAAHPDAEFERL